jgi:hypothetical protein
LSQIADAIAAIARFEMADLVDLYNDSSMALPHLVGYKRLKNPVTGKYQEYKFPDYTSIPFHPETDEYPYPVQAMDMTYDGLLRTKATR